MLDVPPRRVELATCNRRACRSRHRGRRRSKCEEYCGSHGKRFAVPTGLITCAEHFCVFGSTIGTEFHGCLLMCNRRSWGAPYCYLREAEATSMENKIPVKKNVCELLAFFSEISALALLAVS